jgi:hypothetical protein
MYFNRWQERVGALSTPASGRLPRAGPG